MHTACGLPSASRKPQRTSTDFWVLSSWFVVGQLFASVALNRLNASDPWDFRTPIYTQVSEFIWYRASLTDASGR